MQINFQKHNCFLKLFAGECHHEQSGSKKYRTLSHGEFIMRFAMHILANSETCGEENKLKSAISYCIKKEDDKSSCYSSNNFTMTS